MQVYMINLFFKKKKRERDYMINHPLNSTTNENPTKFYNWTFQKKRKKPSINKNKLFSF